MRPERRRIMPRKMPRVSTNTEVRLTAITSSHSSSFILMNRLSCVMPALLTRLSTGPSVLSAVSASAATAARSRKSQGSTETREPSSAASASSRSALVPDMATLAPCACSTLATAPPIPPVAPVTRAPFPVRSNIEASPLPSASDRKDRNGRFHFLGLAYALRLDPVEAPGNSRKYAAGADFIYGAHAVLLQKEHRFPPSHHAS